MNKEPRKINMQRGSYVEGSVHTQGGDMVSGDKVAGDKIAGDRLSAEEVTGDQIAGDKIVQYFQLDLPRMMETLKQTLPENDPLPARLMEALQRFQFFHTRLFEWKELHNALNDTIYALGQFSREVERLDATQEAPNSRSLARLWRPVAQKVDILLEWAKGVRYIADTPYKEPTGANGMQGPAWAVELQAARHRLDLLVEGRGLEINELYDATFDFVDAAEKHMYLADKRLRETATDLYNLSQVVLGSTAGPESAAKE
ncbi:MAG TPA: hypothetical protein PKM21_14400 [Anaerolineales bacterium]|nr:hypothetical protein [Anaerolineales bacterium]